VFPACAASLTLGTPRLYGASVRIGTVTQLWRYPVKSMGGQRLDTAAVTWRGIPGDRA
jgi:MOSC N-terminal beta barrel domain